MRVNQIVRRFHAKRPRNEVEAMELCGVSLRWIGSGAFRNVYTVEDLQIVAKFPHSDDDIDHSCREYRAYRRVMKSKRKFKTLHQYMPTILYFNKASGVLLMCRYKTFDGRSAKIRNQCREIGRKIETALDISRGWADAHFANFGKDAKGRLVMLDLGCLETDPDVQH